MDWDLYCERLGRVKLNQLRMMLARGCSLSAVERALLDKKPLDVIRHFLRESATLGVSLCCSMNGVYGRTAYGVRERIHVVFMGLRMHDSGHVKNVPIDALRAAVETVLEAEGGEFSGAVEVAQTTRGYGSLHRALTAHAHAAQLVDAQNRSRRCSPATSSPSPASASASASASVAVTPCTGKRPRVKYACDDDDEEEEEECAPIITDHGEGTNTGVCKKATSKKTETCVETLVAVKVSAVIISPAPLSSDSSKELAKARDWLSVMEHKHLLVAIDAHKGVQEHVFLRGESADKALAVLGLRRENLATMKRDDAVAAYYGALQGDVVRVDKGAGVIAWFSLK